jgi:hypothetical protein
MSYKRQELLTLREHLSSPPVFWWCPCIVLLCVFTFWVLCCDVRYDFCIKKIFGLSLPPVVVGFVSYLRCLCAVVSDTCCFCFVCLHLVSCVPGVASFSGLSIFSCPFGILWHLVKRTMMPNNSAIINKNNKYLLLQIIEYKYDKYICPWKCIPLLDNSWDMGYWYLMPHLTIF